MPTSTKQQPLFTPVRMGKLELRNRIVMAPLTRMRAANLGHAPTELHAEYYAQRASAGLIIGECTEISPEAYGWADTPGLWSGSEMAGRWPSQRRCPTGPRPPGRKGTQISRHAKRLRLADSGNMRER
jgi:hypothetical protein